MLGKSNLLPSMFIITSLYGLTGCGGPLTPPLFNYSDVSTTFQTGEYGSVPAKPLEVTMRSILQAEQISCVAEFKDESGEVISEAFAEFTDNGPTALNNSHTGVYDDVNAMAPGVNIPKCNVTRNNVVWPAVPGTIIYVFTPDNVEEVLAEIMSEGGLPPLTADLVIDLPDPSIEPLYSVDELLFPVKVSDLQESLAGVGVSFALDSESQLPTGLSVDAITGNVVGTIDGLDPFIPGVYDNIIINAIVDNGDEIPLDPFSIAVNAFTVDSGSDDEPDEQSGDQLDNSEE